MYTEESETYFTRKTVGLELGEEGEVVEVAWANTLGGRRQAKNANARSQTEVERMLAPAAVLMAIVASGGAVGITVDSAVLTVRSSLGVIVVGMAVDTSKAGVVGGNLVAVVAHGLVMRDGKIGVIESGAEPAHRRASRRGSAPRSACRPRTRWHAAR